MNGQEAQQEQKIAEICGRVKTGSGKWAIGVGQWINDVEMLLEIVDSQAQKIAEQAKEIDRLKQKIQGEYDAKAGF